MNIIILRQVLCAIALPLGLLWGTCAQAQADPAFDPNRKFQQSSGQALYQAVCQGCHMAEGQGARGAGGYPPLASNSRMEKGDKLAGVILHGSKAMPSLGHMLNDKQVAAVAQYVRTSFGNRYQEPVTEKMVLDLR